MKIKTETKLGLPLNVDSGDTISLDYVEQYVAKDGTIVGENRIPVLKDEIKVPMKLTKGVIFDVEESDNLGGIGIGGAFIQEKEAE